VAIFHALRMASLNEQKTLADRRFTPNAPTRNLEVTNDRTRAAPVGACPMPKQTRFGCWAC
jgi:hypothetical protein